MRAYLYVEGEAHPVELEIPDRPGPFGAVVHQGRVFVHDPTILSSDEEGVGHYYQATLWNNDTHSQEG